MRKLQNLLILSCVLMVSLTVVAMSSPPKVDTKQVTQLAATDNTQAVPPQSSEVRYCPDPSQLTKQDTLWQTENGEWKSFTQSLENKIKTFSGAQWEGVRVGKIICLYLAEEQNSFPIALERVHSEIILEPNGKNWSALTKGRRFCVSSSTADCSFYVQPAEDLSNIYKQIEYHGGTKNP